MSAFSCFRFRSGVWKRGFVAGESVTGFHTPFRFSSSFPAYSLHLSAPRLQVCSAVGSRFSENTVRSSTVWIAWFCRRHFAASVLFIRLFWELWWKKAGIANLRAIGALSTDILTLYFIAALTMHLRLSVSSEDLSFTDHRCSIHSVHECSVTLGEFLVLRSRIRFAAQAHFGLWSSGFSHFWSHWTLVAS